MGTNRWRGDAKPVAQVTTVQVTAYDAATTYKLTIGNKVISTIAAGGVNATATALAAAWNASTLPEPSRVTASANTDTVTLTADTAGQPFTVTSSVSGGAGTIGAATTTTASAGPYHWDTAANWSLGTVPVAVDDVYIENSAVNILYGLDQSAVTLTSLNIAQSYTGYIGLPYTNIDDATNTYVEYLQSYLKIGATTTNIGLGNGSGSGRIKLDNSNIAATVNIFNSGNGVENGLEAILWKGTNAANVINLQKGSVGVAVFAGETATVATLRCAFKTNKAGDAKIRLGSGVTLTTVSQEGGQIETNGGFTTLNQTGGTININAGNVTTLNIDGGETYYNGVGTITTANVGDGALLSFEKDVRSCTLTNLNLYPGFKFRDPFRRASNAGTLTITMVRTETGQPDFDLGQHIVLARTNGA